jgi:hypothetical protein
VWKNILPLLVLASGAGAQTYTISTVVGGGPVPGQPATSYGLNTPSAVAADSAGNLYVAVFLKCQVWVVNSSGLLSQVIGNGTCGFSGDGGPAASASLNDPYGVAADGSGNVYIADTYNQRIRKVSGGIITTVAGNGIQGYNGDNISATSAELAYPGGVAVDSSGNLFIVDTYNSRIRKVSNGIITTVAGNGTEGYSGDNNSATSAELNLPGAVAVDGSGNLFIADTSNNRIREVSGGIITTVAGNGAYGYNGDNISATSAELDYPYGVAVDNSGNVYIADTWNDRIRKVSGGIITTFAVGVSNPEGVAAVGINVYVADTGNNRIGKVSSGGVTTVVGDGLLYGGDGGAATSAELLSPSWLAVDGAGNFFIADSADCVVREVAATTGIITTVAGNGTCGYNGDNISATSAELAYPFGVAVDSSGNLFIADSDNSRVRKVSGGIITTVAGDGTVGYNGDNISATFAKLDLPWAVAVDSSGNLFIADTYNQRIRKVSGGIITTVAGNGTPGYNGDNISATSAELANPFGVAVDSSGNLFIADTYNERIRKVSGGIITTVVGNGILGYSDNISATSAELDLPWAVAVDSSGNLFIADTYNQRIRKVSGGVITTVAGNGTPGYIGDGGPATFAELNTPQGVALDTSGNVYLSDTGNNRIRKLAPNNNPLPGLPSIVIDAPAANAIISGITLISGWALDNTIGVGSGISSVQVKVDGIVKGTASYGISRPDVCAAFPGRPGCPDVGYIYQLDTSSLTPGSHTITVSATDSDPTSDTGLASVNVTVATPPSVRIDSPLQGSVLSGVATVSGWAIDNVSTLGTSIVSVQVAVDGVAVGNATYGTARPDVCAAYPGRPGCPNVGFTYSLNTAALSPGSHVLTVSATDSDGNPDIGSSSITITVAGSLPSVFVDTPTSGAMLSGTATVSGWAIDSIASVGTAIAGVQVKVDGAVVGTATYGTPRLDVCGAFPGRPGCPNVGFTYALDTTKLAPGAHTLSVVATDSDGTPDAGTWTVAIQVAPAPPPPTIFIDTPVPNAVIGRTVTVSGWALDNASVVGTAIGSVQVKVDGTVVGTATYGTPRPDVCAAFPGRPGCPNVGFTYQLNTSSLSAGMHTITAVATDTDTSPDVGSYSVSVTVSAATLPSVVIDSLPAGSNGLVAVSGTVTVSGWALDNTLSVGTAIGSVQIQVDGAVVGNAAYGLARPDVCAAFPSRFGCPNVGFTYQLNTASLTAGTHTITATATDTDGTPDTGSFSVAVTVPSGATPPSVSIDSPSAGATVSGAVTISGWAIDSIARIGTAISSVQVLVDYQFVGNATYGVARPDVCTAFPSRIGCPNVGFSYQLNTAPLSSGNHTITILATDLDATNDVGSSSVVVKK